MEHVIVTFPTNRIVYVDRKKNGKTNDLIRVDAATHIFDLGTLKNYKPDSRTVAVFNTTILDPMKIAFSRKE